LTLRDILKIKTKSKQILFKLNSIKKLVLYGKNPGNLSK
jgi:hypothetical protein